MLALCCLSLVGRLATFFFCSRRTRSRDNLRPFFVRETETRPQEGGVLKKVKLLERCVIEFAALVPLVRTAPKRPSDDIDGVRCSMANFRETENNGRIFLGVDFSNQDFQTNSLTFDGAVVVVT